MSKYVIEIKLPKLLFNYEPLNIWARFGEFRMKNKIFSVQYSWNDIETFNKS